MATIEQTVLQAEVPAFIELFEIDVSVLGITELTELTGGMFRYTAMVGEGDAAVIWEGNPFLPYPIQLTGLAQNSESAPPRPQLALANINKTLGTYLFRYGDLIGARVTYIRTFETYLGTDVPGKSLPPLKFVVGKKLSHNRTGVTWELRTFLDKERAFLPSRQMLKSEFPGLGVNKSIR